jgi:hypothetical protein
MCTNGAPTTPYPQTAATGYATESRLSLFGDVNQQIGAAMGRVIALTGQVSALADSLYGPEPKLTTTGGATSAPLHDASSRAGETRNNLT